jgi:hypothetical protein
MSFSLFTDLVRPLEPDVDMEGDDALSKFMRQAPLDAAIGRQHAVAFRAEVAPIGNRAADIYKTLAASDQASSQALEKRSKTTIEETHYASGTVVVAELENGVVVKTYMKDAA